MNFHITPDPEKSDGKMFGKSVKTLIFCHFGPILPILGKEKKIFFFFVEKSSSISLLILQLSVNMQKIRKKQEAVTK